MRKMTDAEQFEQQVQAIEIYARAQELRAKAVANGQRISQMEAHLAAWREQNAAA
jgi:hypothetical protein